MHVDQHCAEVFVCASIFVFQSQWDPFFVYPQYFELANFFEVTFIVPLV